jgi:GntR family transcriptional regulator
MPASMPLPKYHQVYLVLKERLREGLYDVKMPGEMELSEEFGVSRVTLRTALGKLSQEGLIERAAGRGTRRVGGAPPAPAGRHTGLLESIVTNSRNTTVQVLAHERVPATESVAAALQILVGTVVLRVVRVRSTTDGPVSYMVAWVPAPHAARLTRRRLERKPILALIEETGTPIAHAVQTVSARQADSVVAGHLQVPVGQALLAVSRVVFDANDKPVQWLQGLYRPDRYEYEMKLSRSDDSDAARIWIGAEHTTRVG